MADGAGRKLVLMRHAKSAWPDVPDHQRPLAARGQRDAPVMGIWLRTAGHVPDLVLCSTALRARETWQLARARLGTAPPVSLDEGVYQGSAMQLLNLIRRAPLAVRTLLLGGHDPAIQGLALTLAATTFHLSGAAPPDALDRMRAKFPTAAIAVFEFPGELGSARPGESADGRFRDSPRPGNQSLTVR